MTPRSIAPRRFFRGSGSLLLIAALLFFAAGDARAATLIVEADTTVTKEDLSGCGAIVLRHLPAYGAYQVQADGARLGSVTHSLRALGGVRDVRVEGELEALQQVEDPLYPQQWWLTAIAAPELWELPELSSSPVVAVLDTGLDPLSVEFSGRVVSPASFAQADFETAVTDFDGHGTRVASIIAAEVGNGYGGAGVNPRARIMPVKLSHTQTFKESAAVAAIDYAVEQGADIINMSWGSRDSYPLIRTALQKAGGRGVLMIAAAGNGAGEPVFFPGSSPGVIAVGSITRDGERAHFSATGPEMELVSPGEWIVVGGRDGEVPGGPVQGTSFSAPMVSGAASLILSANRSLSAREVRAFLAETAVDLGPPGRDSSFGYGVVAAGAAVRKALLDLARGDSFADVGEGHPYRASIETLADTGVVSGYADGLFRPDNRLLRAQFAKMVVLTMGLHTATVDRPGNPTFRDVRYQGDPYPYDYIEEAAAARIIRGYTDGTFGPYREILRGQLIAMVARAARLPEPPADYETSFGNFSPALYPAARKAAYAGLLDGLVGVGPGYDFWQPADRGEAAALLYALLLHR